MARRGDKKRFRTRLDSESDVESLHKKERKRTKNGDIVRRRSTYSMVIYRVVSTKDKHK